MFFHGRLINAQPDIRESIGSYFPYGEDKGVSNPANDSVKFATYTRDSVNGLDYANQRYFLPGASRFSTSDPSQLSGEGPNPESWNRFAYAISDPINRNDPTGLDSDTCGAFSTEYCENSPILQDSDPMNLGTAPSGFVTVPCPAGTAVPGICTMSDAAYSAVVNDEFVSGAAAVVLEGLGTTICLGSGVCEIVLIGAGGVATAYVAIEAGSWLYDELKKKSLPACNPPVGTIGYRYDTVPPGRPHYPFKGDHVHLFVMNQNPNTGACYWNKLAVTAPPPPPGAVPIP
jgi:RHS repeat-associated protein